MMIIKQKLELNILERICIRLIILGGKISPVSPPFCVRLRSSAFQTPTVYSLVVSG